jgi:hypothetical protein
VGMPASDATPARKPVRPRRTLVVANEGITRAAVLDRLREELNGAASPEVLVVCPALAESVLDHTLGTVDVAIGPANRRLRESVAALRSLGIEAKGEVGDSDPLVAIGDELRTFDADKLVIVSRPEETARPAERDLLERVEKDFELPIVQILVDPERPSATTAVRRTGAEKRARQNGDSGPSNMPSLARRDWVAIGVGMFGTFALVLLAADCASRSGHLIEGACAVRMLIAMGAVLINLAHVVALVLFGSVAYRGLWERFFARLTLYGTPLAVAVSIALG